MNYLLDVNVLVAWGWDDHPHHDRASRWVTRVRAEGMNGLLTSAIPQIGFSRVSVQRSAGAVTPEQAGRALKKMLMWLGAGHRFVPDDVESYEWSFWCITAARTTDAHLLALAKAHDAKLATLDSGIPGAFVIP